MSKKSPLPSPGKADLITATKAMVVANDNSFREIADNVALLQSRHSMSQREIGAEIGKTHGWVCRVLKWREEGFPEHGPFGPASKAARKRRASGETTGRRKRRASGQSTDHQETGPETATGQADTGTETATGANADTGNDTDAQATADARKAEYAAEEATAPTSEADLQGFVDRWLSQMDDGMVAKAKALVAAWERKTAAAMPVDEPAPSASAPAAASPEGDGLDIPPFLQRVNAEPQLRAAA